MSASNVSESEFAQVLADSCRPPARSLPLKRDVAHFVDGLLGLLFPQLAEEAAGTL